MAKLFRAITNKKTKWMWDNPPLSWLDEGDIPAGPLVHIIPEKHKLSVYEVNGDQKRIDAVATAIAFSRGTIDDVEYIVFDESNLAEVGFEIDKNAPGNTYDPEVNLWHRDILNVSANKLVALAKRILPVVVPDFVLKKRVDEVFREAVRRKKVHWERVNLKREEKERLKQQYEGKN